MKYSIVKLNFPLQINIAAPGETNYHIIYGFFAPYSDDLDEQDIIDEDIYYYCAYLSAMCLWSLSCLDEFTLTDDKDWIDKNGEVHSTASQWAFDLGERCMEQICLDYTLSVIEFDDVRDDCYNCGVDTGLITCKCCLDHFETIAQMQKKEQCNVCVFNRPIWLPRQTLFPGEDGFCHIYGFTTNKELEEDHLKDCNIYLGYLALCEEQNLNGISPSGYTANLEKNGQLWHGNGREYSCRSKEIEAECHLCQKKHNLRLCGATVKISQADMIDGVKNDFILSEELYGNILGQISEQKTDVDVQN